MTISEVMKDLAKSRPLGAADPHSVCRFLRHLIAGRVPKEAPQGFWESRQTCIQT